MSRFIVAGALLLSVMTTLNPVAAQEAQLDPAFSDEVIRTFDLPETEVSVSADGVTAPAELNAGVNLVTLSVEEPYIGYVNIVQYPEDLDEATAAEQALMAGAGDMPQPGWTYFGGTNTPDVGLTATFAIDLAPGTYAWAVSYYTPPEGADEVMQLAPFTVVEGDGDAAAAPESTVRLEMTDDLQYIVTPDPVPAGPQVWEITNTGMHHAHHVVMVAIPEGVTAAEIVNEFNGLFAGTPPAEDSLMMQAVWTGYAALQSGGQTTWAEFNLDPGTYAVICYIMDPETGRPHVLDGMATVFTVE